MSANTRLDSLADLAHNKANLMIRCRCGHHHIYDAERFNRYAMIRGWNTMLETIHGRLKCARCGRRGPDLHVTPMPPTLADPFPRSEDEWRQLYRRMRD